jgi:hypothetical protein
MNGPPLCKPNSPNKPIWALSPFSLDHFGTWKLRWIGILYTSTKKTGKRLSGWLAIMEGSTLLMIWSTTLVRAKTRLELKAGLELQVYCLSSLFPLCECLPLAGIPSTSATNSTLQHYFMSSILLMSWSRGRWGQLHKCTFSLPK